jgi:hypothetical protein
MTPYKKGDQIGDAILLRRVSAEEGGRFLPAWVCRLPEGRIKTIKERDLKRRKGNRPPPLAASRNRIYMEYMRRSRLRNVYFELTIEEFHAIAQQNCVYCGCKPSNGGRKEPYTYNGLDRKNNNMGYTISNTAPCCAKCNAIKSNLLSFDEMRVAMAAILTWRKKSK